MKELHVSTEIKGRFTLEIVGRIVAELWHQKDETTRRLMGYKDEDAPIEENYAEGELAGLDLAMEIIVNTIAPDYFTKPIVEN